MVESTLPLPLLRKGKVREVYNVDDDTVLLVASDRISAFDVVLREAIPDKGAVLTQVSAYWFEKLGDIVPNHFITANAKEIVDRVPALTGHEATLGKRAMLARRVTPVPFECVIRGYITGSAWKEYAKSGTLAGDPLPAGLVESQQLDPPIFSPATKAEVGHDENVTFERVANDLGAELATQLKDVSFALYEAGRDQAKERGIIIADTKFEFGHDENGTLRLIDEVLTPDSSRFWPADEYEPGRGQRSFDKQPMRDHLAALKKAGEWDGESVPEGMTDEIVKTTSDRYRDAFFRITGQSLDEVS